MSPLIERLVCVACWIFTLYLCGLGAFYLWLTR